MTHLLLSIKEKVCLLKQAVRTFVKCVSVHGCRCVWVEVHIAGIGGKRSFVSTNNLKVPRRF